MYDYFFIFIVTHLFSLFFSGFFTAGSIFWFLFWKIFYRIVFDGMLRILRHRLFRNVAMLHDSLTPEDSELEFSIDPVSLIAVYSYFATVAIRFQLYAYRGSRSWIWKRFFKSICACTISFFSNPFLACIS